jgi:hypothetical protein
MTPTSPEVTRLKPEEELRQKALARFGFAPGWYSCKCTCCRSEYIGDKRSTCCQQCAEVASRAPSEPEAPRLEKLVEDIAADICDTVNMLNGMAYTPLQWMGTAGRAIKHFTHSLSDPDKWAQQNPEAWEALRTGRAGVYGDLVLRDEIGFEYTIRERLDKPFVSEVKEGV